MRKAGSGAVKAASLSLSSAGWENNGTSNRKGLWGTEERLCSVRCVDGHSLGTSSDDFLWAAGNEIRIRARATDIRDMKRLVLSRSRLTFTQSGLGGRRESAFRKKKMNWVKVMA